MRSCEELRHISYKPSKPEQEQVIQVKIKKELVSTCPFVPQRNQIYSTKPPSLIRLMLLREGIGLHHT